MERRPTALLVLLALLPSYTWIGGSGAAVPPSPSPKASPAPSSSASNASPAPPSAAQGSTLDPRQLTALQSMGFPTATDPCADPSPHGNATACDDDAPFRHLVSLRLANCSPDLD
ncbi:hypothetical protein GW17_00035018, partial [Ensete ventricosum]